MTLAGVERTSRSGALRWLLTAWRDEGSVTEFQPGEHRRYVSLGVRSDSLPADGEMHPPLSTPRLLALAVLLDDDSGAAAALADYMVESGVEPFVAERERMKEAWSRAILQLSLQGYLRLGERDQLLSRLHDYLFLSEEERIER